MTTMHLTPSSCPISLSGCLPLVSWNDQLIIMQVVVVYRLWGLVEVALVVMKQQLQGRECGFVAASCPFSPPPPLYPRLACP
jgi:hypothetical protein